MDNYRQGQGSGCGRNLNQESGCGPCTRAQSNQKRKYGKRVVLACEPSCRVVDKVSKKKARVQGGVRQKGKIILCLEQSVGRPEKQSPSRKGNRQAFRYQEKKELWKKRRMVDPREQLREGNDKV